MALPALVLRPEIAGRHANLDEGQPSFAAGKFCEFERDDGPRCVARADRRP